jgi:AcrR family transcriptional regulator
MSYRKGLESRIEILDAASDVVLRLGFDATSFGDVCDELEISRGKLTHHFPTKEALFEAIVDYRFARFRDRVLAPIVDASVPPHERIHRWLEATRAIYVDDGQRVPGCYIGHTAMELASRTPAMHASLNALLGDWRSALERVLIDAGRTPEEAHRRAIFAIAAIEGAIMLSRAQPDKTALLTTLHEVERMLLESESATVL